MAAPAVSQVSELWLEQGWLCMACDGDPEWQLQLKQVTWRHQALHFTADSWSHLFSMVGFW